VECILSQAFFPGNAHLKGGCILNLNMAYIIYTRGCRPITQPGVPRAE